MKAEQLAVVQGWDDTRATLRRWNANPWRVLGALGARLAARHRAAARRHLARGRDHAVPDPTASQLPRRDARRPTAARLRLPAVPQRHSCSRCTRWPAWRASSPGSQLPTAARGLLGLVRKLHDRAGPLAIVFVAAATLFSLAHAGLRARPRRRRPALRSSDISPLRCCSRCCRTRCPSCSRSSCRSPPGRSPAAAAPGTSCWPRRSPRRRSRSRCCVLAAAIETWVTPTPAVAITG